MKIDYLKITMSTFNHTNEWWITKLLLELLYCGPHFNLTFPFLLSDEPSSIITVQVRNAYNFKI